MERHGGQTPPEREANNPIDMSPERLAADIALIDGRTYAADDPDDQNNPYFLKRPENPPAS